MEAKVKVHMTEDEQYLIVGATIVSKFRVEEDNEENNPNGIALDRNCDKCICYQICDGYDYKCTKESRKDHKNGYWEEID